jgi:poly(A) polymerase/tRNA nucleotidyltransferase (CCA-adding enzyme)
MVSKIPEPVINIVRKLEAEGFEAFIVGGCVRDLLMAHLRQGYGGQDIGPKDWDVTTNAKPEEIVKIFPDSFYENKFGTVGVKIPKNFSKVRPFPPDSPAVGIPQDQTLKNSYEVVEVTTYRIESKYSDKRHPDEVRFAKTLEEDLSRRDFTINALALRVNFSKVRPFPSSSEAPGIPQGQTLKNSEYEIIDLFGGQEDLKNKIIRAVGDPNERFDEDALRMMRAVRFAITLANESEVKRIRANAGPRKLGEKTPFTIEPKTFEAIKRNARNLRYIAIERIRDELNKVLLSDCAAEGIELLRELKLLQYVLPELEKGVGVSQNRHHIYTIYEHSILSLRNCPSEKLEVRLATLLHDIAKPETKRGEGAYSTFYNHDHVGARVVEKILRRLKYSSDIIRKVKLLVDNHMFYYNVDEVGASSVRRLVRKVGLENIDDLIDLRIGDRLGSGVPKAVPYKLRHFRYMVDRISKDPLSVKMLKLNGNDLMKELKLQPGPKVGAILDVLLSEVMDEPKRNKEDILLARAKELQKENLEKLRELAKEKIEERKEEEDKEIKAKYYVK